MIWYARAPALTRWAPPAKVKTAGPIIMWLGFSRRTLFPLPRRFAKSVSDSTPHISAKVGASRADPPPLVRPDLVLIGTTALEWDRDLSGASEEFPERKRMDASPPKEEVLTKP